MRIFIMYSFAALVGLFVLGPIGAILALLLVWLTLQIKSLKTPQK